MEEKFIPVHIKTVKPAAIENFDIFFKTSDGTMVLYCAQGKVVNQEVREKIHEHSIETLYVRKREKKDYDLYIERFIASFLRDPDIDTPVKARAAYDSIKTVAEDLFENPKADIIRRYKKMIYELMDFILADNSAFLHLIGLTSFDFTTYDHCINVGILGIGLTKVLLNDSPDHNLAEIAAGFFLHDIGKITIPVTVLNKKSTLLPGDWKLIKSHPEEGCAILESCGMLTEEAEIIVMQHHERHDGTGYPRGLRGDQIHLYAKICAIADVFDALTSYRPFRAEFTTFEALKIMKLQMQKEFDPDFFAHFVNLFSE